MSVDWNARTVAWLALSAALTTELLQNVALGIGCLCIIASIFSKKESAA